MTVADIEWLKRLAQGWDLPCQVSEWIQRVLTIGAAFAGADGAEGLRSLLTAQAENFFRSATCHFKSLCKTQEVDSGARALRSRHCWE